MALNVLCVYCYSLSRVLLPIYIIALTSRLQIQLAIGQRRWGLDWELSLLPPSQNWPEKTQQRWTTVDTWSLINACRELLWTGNTITQDDLTKWWLMCIRLLISKGKLLSLWGSSAASTVEKQCSLPSPSVDNGRELLPNICNGSWSAGPGPLLPVLGAETPVPCCAESAKGWCKHVIDCMQILRFIFNGPYRWYWSNL